MTQSKWFKFQPTKEIWIVLLSWVMVVSAFYSAFQVFTTQRVAANFITFGIIGITLCGVMVPAVWNTLIMKRPLAVIGITKRNLLVSIVLGAALAIAQYMMTIKNIELPVFNELLPLVTMAVACGFYENLFYRGWVQLRMEEYFGIIPSIALSAIIYSLYHIGYGMPTEEMITLFVIGIVYSMIFRVTSNVFILYPLLTPSGAVFTTVQDGLRIPFEATYGFALVIGLTIMGMVMVDWLYKKKSVSVLPKVKNYFMGNNAGRTL
ncbi:MAG: hypothetical protein APF77_00480 [Clostridia bacterium BRH_c25]|nr:MAG: hypothetical protein APF77_00480 [Clostridia bacterium BRH_c25]